MKNAKDAAPRKNIGPARLAFVAATVVFILYWEYNWLMTPWWLKAAQYCSSLTFQTVIMDVRGWLGW